MINRLEEVKNTMKKGGSFKEAADNILTFELEKEVNLNFLISKLITEKAFDAMKQILQRFAKADMIKVPINKEIHKKHENTLTQQTDKHSEKCKRIMFLERIKLVFEKKEWGVACSLIEEFGEDPRHYPEMLTETQNKMVSYYVCKTLLPSSHSDHKHLTQLFHLFEDCPSLQILLINQLIANNKRNEALATCLQFNLFHKLSARTKDLLQKAKHIQTNQFFLTFWTC